MMRVCKREGIIDAEREMVYKTAGERHRFQELNRYYDFLDDHVPWAADAIKACGLEFRHDEDRNKPGRIKVIQQGYCRRHPWCITCMKVAEGRRVRRALDKFSMCTPAGQKPRFVHIVMTCPVYEDGTGPGMAASQDVAGFGRAVWRTLEEMYGPGHGAIMSYQDFGEKAFRKRHPHMDLTVNGWALGEEGPVGTEPLPLKGGGYDRLQANFQMAMQAVVVGPASTSIDVGSMRTGVKEYYRILRYQMREMVDFRKLEYNRGRKEVHWLSYKHGTRTPMPVGIFLADLDEYKRRLGQWPGRNGKKLNLHRAYGHISDRRIKATQAITGGTRLPHGDSCPCARCGDWDRVWPDEAGKWAAKGTRVESPT